MAKSSGKKGRGAASRRVDARPQKTQKQKGKSAFAEKPAGEKKAFVMVPWILLGVSLVLALCFILGACMGEDGAGVIGTAVQWFFCGLFGSPAFLLPIVLGYVSVRYICFNFNWRVGESGFCGWDDPDFVKNRGRLIRQVVMACLAFLILCVIVGVLAGYDSLDAIDVMWSDSADLLEGGGVIGSSLGALMVMGFQPVISIVILILLMALVVVLMLPLERIAELIRIRMEERREEKEALAAELAAEEAEREREEKKHAARMAAEAARRVAAQEKAAQARALTSADPTADFSEEDMEDAPPLENIAHEAPGPYIGPSPEMLQKEQERAYAATEAQSAMEEDEPLTDFGGDEGFDSQEYSALDDFIRNAGLKSESVEPKQDNIPELSRMENEELLSDMAAVVPEEGEEDEVEEPLLPYVYPPIDLLELNRDTVETDYTKELQENAQRLVDTLQSFRVGIQSITYSRGPTITRYELKPNAGVKVRSIANLVDDIALSLATSGVRIEAPIPNKPAVGIEVPNRNRATVYLRDLIDNQKFKEAKSRLTSALGMDVGGNPIYFDIAKMPHLLIAGATGMGKSVCINSIIVSLLYKSKPEDVKLILIDPKKVEFNIYKDIPHLYAPIISDPKKAAGALASAVAEMERRFEMIEEVGVRDITTYNAVTENDPEKEHMTHMVIIIDELADLMMTAADEVETSICRLAQKARAAGIHIIIGTQRPSVDVITGLIKANIPSRIACTVASQVDSRTIIDIAGAEKLIGRGDMLFAPVGAAKPMRVQGAFVSEAEVEKVVTFIRENNSKAKFNADFINRIEEEAAKCGMGKKGASAGADMSGMDDGIEGGDSKFREAVKLAIEQGKISTSLMQRRLGVGYGRAAKIIDTMEQMGYVSKPDGNKPRRVLITMDEYMRRVAEGSLGETQE